MTKKSLTRHSVAVISSTIPSAKYPWSGSPLIFWNGSTAIDGLSGRSSVGRSLDPPPAQPHPIGPYRMPNVLELLLAGVLECYVELAPDLSVSIVRYANAAGLGN